jgi:hypothetical protein
MASSSGPMTEAIAATVTADRMPGMRLLLWGMIAG